MALTCINLGTNLHPTKLTERVGKEEIKLVGFLLWPPTWLKNWFISQGKICLDDRISQNNFF